MFPFRDDPEFLATFRAGERGALETVYRFYVRPLDVYLRGLARRTGGSELSQPSAVSDLLQETFVRAFSHDTRHSYDGLRDYAPYLYAIARNCLVDALRKRRTELPLSPDELPLSTDGEQNAGDDAYDPETLAVLESYVRALPLPLRRVYEKRFELGLTQEAACSALGISRRKLRTAEDHLRRGLRKALILARIRGPATDVVVGSFETERR